MPDLRAYRGEITRSFNRLTTTWLLVCLLAFASGSGANEAYAGFKAPPLPIESEPTLPRKGVTVHGFELAYVEAGQGDPILFLHGVPTSSYLWRNVMPHLEGQGRVIAMDLLGFGQSAAQESAMTFEEHYELVAGFIAALGLERLTLVMHDWGSALGLHYARLHPNKVRAIATMEAIVAPTMPADSYDALQPGSAAFFRRVRAPVSGPREIIEENYFIESALPQAVVRPLTEQIHNHYRMPFRTSESRKFLASWPAMMPIGGVPTDTKAVVSAYNQWLEQTDIPWLFLYARPGTLNPPSTADYWVGKAKNIEVTYIGAGRHFVQEDQPYAIGRALADWYRRSR